MIVLSADPPYALAAWSYADGRAELLSARHNENPFALASWARWQCGTPRRLVVERPDRAEVPIGDIITLSIRTGELVSAIRATAGADVNVEWLRPQAWKRSLPKPDSVRDEYIVERRACRFLDHAERDRVPDLGDRGNMQDLWDAIGVGLVAFKRCEPGLVW